MNQLLTDTYAHLEARVTKCLGRSDALLFRHLVESLEEIVRIDVPGGPCERDPDVTREIIYALWAELGDPRFDVTKMADEAIKDHLVAVVKGLDAGISQRDERIDDVERQLSQETSRAQSLESLLLGRNAEYERWLAGIEAALALWGTEGLSDEALWGTEGLSDEALWGTEGLSDEARVKAILTKIADLREINTRGPSDSAELEAYNAATDAVLRAVEPALGLETLEAHPVDRLGAILERITLIKQDQQRFEEAFFNSNTDIHRWLESLEGALDIVPGEGAFFETRAGVIRLEVMNLKHSPESPDDSAELAAYKATCAEAERRAEALLKENDALRAELADLRKPKPLITETPSSAPEEKARRFDDEEHGSNIPWRASYSPEEMTAVVRDLSQGMVISEVAKRHGLSPSKVVGIERTYSREIDEARYLQGLALDEYFAAFLARQKRRPGATGEVAV